MTSEPLVSVVTPVYNDADYLTECVTSVLNQTYSNWEYAIVDNASTDETPEIAARFAASDSRIRHVRFEEFVNSNENHNRAFRAIDPGSEFCKVVSADDWLFPECLERMVARAKASETVGPSDLLPPFGRRSGLRSASILASLRDRKGNHSPDSGARTGDPWRPHRHALPI